MADEKRVDEPTGTDLVGHEWDGIEELDTPMPRWWLWTFYATIVWALGYVILYPAWPMVNRATDGLLGWSSRGQLEQELAAERERQAPVRRALAALPIEQLHARPDLMQAAVEGGRAAFRVNCVQCHGSGAAGSPGYPNLNDDEWLWGGDIASIHHSIVHGIRQPDHAETRMSQMPAFGRDGLLQAAEIDDLTSYVRSLSGHRVGGAAKRRGAALFAVNCAACHGADAKGDRAIGAPDLTDAIWLYGGDAATIRTSIANSRYGVMPRWGHRLDPVTLKMLAAYVHSLGGGEGGRSELAAAERGAGPSAN
jgi:cytochrome c oxidase cbb3-type subunit III